MSKRIKSTPKTTKAVRSVKIPEKAEVGSVVKMKTGKMGRNVFLLVLVLLVLVGLFYAKSIFVAAIVNGRPVSRLSIVKSLEKTGGKQVLDSLITKELITQEAKKNNIVIADEDVQKEIENLSKTVQAQGTTLDAALATQNMTKEDLQQNIRMQKTVEQLLSSQIAVSDDEVKKYFDQNKASFGTDPKYDDLKDTIKKDLQQEKLSTEFQKWYQKLQSESSIKYFVSY